MNDPCHLQMAFTCEKLLEAGALDVWTTAVCSLTREIHNPLLTYIYRASASYAHQWVCMKIHVRFYVFCVQFLNASTRETATMRTHWVRML